MTIENFKLKEYLLQPPEVIEEYLVALRYLKPRETKREIFNMKLKHVEMIKRVLDSGNDRDLIVVVSKVQKISEEDVIDLSIIEFFGVVASVREQLKVIVTAEENGLTPTNTDFKWEAVQGSQRMSKFGIYNTLESLSGGDALKYKAYMNMNYAEVFTILLMRKTASDLQREMSQIKTK
ncbi:MAG: hypothetical protein KAR20_14260 [Candidatus Heimdallarchaeota archaeon]|nr:hypothetical protein [Candidatus Heimdallarchaeota archaeon]